MRLPMENKLQTKSLFLQILQTLNNPNMLAYVSHLSLTCSKPDLRTRGSGNFYKPVVVETIVSARMLEA